MNRTLTNKLTAISILTVLLLIPLFMIDGVIMERQTHRDEVLQDIARSSSYEQRISGPLLVVPYRKTVREWKQPAGEQKRYLEEREVAGQLVFLPERLDLNGTVNTEIRARGIYQARLYHAANHVSGHFQLPARWGIGDAIADYRFDAPYIALGISDIRGIESAMKLQLNDQPLKFLPGSKLALLGPGVHAELPAGIEEKNARMEFAFDLKLQGTGSLEVTPVGRDTAVSLASTWPHPSFIGDYLPSQREVSEAGFSARWNTSFFSTNLEQALKSCVETADCKEFNARRFGVSLIDPVDQYLKSDRAVKYALLFIALTFAGFFLFEVLKQLAVHPVQYSLVGVALAFFYLLLLSLSEHIGFALAYLLSSVACVSLIGFYVSHVLRDGLRGVGFATSLGALYGLLYGLLSAEDYALLMGSLFIFGVLAVTMVLTRHIDWYSVGCTGFAE